METSVTKINVEEIVENEDGSATVTLQLNEEALQLVVQHFVTTALSNLIKESSLDSSAG